MCTHKGLDQDQCGSRATFGKRSEVAFADQLTWTFILITASTFIRNPNRLMVVCAGGGWLSCCTGAGGVQNDLTIYTSRCGAVVHFPCLSVLGGNIRFTWQTNKCSEGWRKGVCLWSIYTELPGALYKTQHTVAPQTFWPFYLFCFVQIYTVSNCGAGPWCGRVSHSGGRRLCCGTGQDGRGDVTRRPAVGSIAVAGTVVLVVQQIPYEKERHEDIGTEIED